MKKILFGFLCLVILSVSSCFKIENKDDIITFPSPAVLQYNSTNELVLSSKAGVFLAPELESKLNTEINIGDLVFSVFSVNLSKPKSASGYYTAYDILLAKVYTRTPVATEGGVSETGDYNSSIREIQILDFWNNYLYFGLIHSAPEGQEFVYEMTYDINEKNKTPTVYIRAKKSGEDITGDVTNTAMFYAFDMTELALKFINSDNRLNLNIMFKTGVDKEGNEVFTNFPLNPVFLVFE